MPHDNHTDSNLNQDCLGLDSNQALAKYLDMAGDWVDPVLPPRLLQYEISSGTGLIVADHEHKIGTKARFGDLLVRTIQDDAIVYVCPRYGYAGISLTYLCRKYGKRLVLFMPASKEVSVHQRWCIENGAEVHFHRVAAMPNLNKIAAEWAKQNGGFFVPLGLKHPLVTAAAVKVIDQLGKTYGCPPEVWCAISTGVLSRAIQIALPDTQVHAIAVSRNIKEGERGTAKLQSSPLAFAQDAKYPPPFESASNYDAKVWQYFYHQAVNRAWCWNVAGNVTCETTQETLFVDSNAKWGEKKVFGGKNGQST